MKKTFLFLAAILATLTATAQTDSVRTEKPIDASANELKNLLRWGGYELFAYDLSPFRDANYRVELFLQEFERETKIAERMLFRDVTIRRISDFNEKDQQEILAEGSALDPERDIYEQYDRLTIGFLPIQGDTLRRAVINLVGSGTLFSRIPVRAYNCGDRHICEYFTVPFKPSPIQPGQITPLFMLASSWCSSDGFNQFCGPTELTPGEPSLQQKHSPHYYIFGIKLEKAE